ncbi:hypothetical protein EV122DRAFT_274533 [Schizophyllum commune]
MYPTDFTDPEDFFPEFDYIAQLGSAASTTADHCEALVRLLWYAREGAQVIRPIRDSMRSIADCLALSATALQVLQDIFETIRRIISTPTENLKDELSQLSAKYHSTLDALKDAGSATESSIEALSTSEPEALASIAYPPVIHFFLVQAVGSQWNDRLYASAKLAPFFARVKADLRHIGSLTVQLQLSIEGMRERFSVAKMLEYRDLSAGQQVEVDQFLGRTAVALEMRVHHIKSNERAVRRFNAPVLEEWSGAAHSQTMLDLTKVSTS